MMMMMINVEGHMASLQHLSLLFSQWSLQAWLGPQGNLCYCWTRMSRLLVGHTADSAKELHKVVQSEQILIPPLS